jgi:hypothetical protein
MKQFNLAGIIAGIIGIIFWMVLLIGDLYKGGIDWWTVVYVLMLLQAVHKLTLNMQQYFKEPEKPPRAVNGFTYREYFCMFPEPYRTQAITNMLNEPSRKDSIDDIAPSNREALRCGFCWFATPEKREYWQSFWEKLDK